MMRHDVMQYNVTKFVELWYYVVWSRMIWWKVIDRLRFDFMFYTLNCKYSWFILPKKVSSSPLFHLLLLLLLLLSSFSTSSFFSFSFPVFCSFSLELTWRRRPMNWKNAWSSYMPVRNLSSPCYDVLCYIPLFPARHCYTPLYSACFAQHNTSLCYTKVFNWIS